MSDELIIQALLVDDSVTWQVHNCKLTQQSIVYDGNLSLLAHYDTLDDELKCAHPLTMTLLKHMDKQLSADEAAAMIGVPASAIASAWQIKYVGRVVIFCEALQLALRIHFSNTSKHANALYIKDKHTALMNEAANWRSFGVVDVLTKSTRSYISLDTQNNELILTQNAQYQALPSSHSLAITQLLNDDRPLFDWLDTTVCNFILDAINNHTDD